MMAEEKCKNKKKRRMTSSVSNSYIREEYPNFSKNKIFLIELTWEEQK